ncbi:tektin-4 [Episyrphus balteatus]|uniref:tektin-4 n=1 Tax=Episyrphus balteatus TaxID=286459 RepID=UPI002485CA22|nr:tektin-4 [Episyrphus balteatus]
MHRCMELEKLQEVPGNEGTEIFPKPDHYGARCIKNDFSITQLSTNDWHAKNKEIFDNATRIFDETKRNEYISKTQATHLLAQSDKMQQENYTNVKNRVKFINEMKTALHRAISAMKDEITTLEEDEIRIQNSSIALRIPESITKECLSKRSYRPETELTLDDPENELIKELNLISEIKIKLRNALSEIQEQKIENRNARQRLEYDWSDKSEAYEIESKVCGLNNKSTLLMNQPGVTSTSAEQSSEQFWEHFTKETLSECEKCRIKSVKLRGRLTSMILCVTRDLRIQADNTERALTLRINCTQETVQRMENELEECLKKLAENDNCIQQMIKAINSFDSPTKVAHTRLYYRNYRPRVENCNDRTQSGLINEINNIEDGVSNLIAVLKESEEKRNQLNINRNKLEREIIFKRKTIMLDAERCTALRSRYPSATALSGFLNTL